MTRTLERASAVGMERSVIIVRVVLPMWSLRNAVSAKTGSMAWGRMDVEVSKLAMIVIYYPYGQ